LILKDKKKKLQNLEAQKDLIYKEIKEHCATPYYSTGAEK